MILLTNLTATPCPISSWAQPRDTKSAVHHEMFPGIFVHAEVGASGLVIRHGNIGVHIALHELLKLALTHEPLLGPDPAATIESAN